jgi:GNAT superfamily N-acetyltransferase
MIRAAVEADLDALVTLGAQFHQEHYAGFLPCNAVQFRSIGAHLIENPHGTLLVLERAGERIGMLGAMLITHPLSGEWICSELFWYARPAARGDGVKLLKAATEWARSNGARKLQMVAPNDRVGEFYARCGFEKVETAWQLTLAPPAVVEGVA